MNAIALIVNPFAGTDIRRLVTHATVFDDREKVNIAKRIVLSARKLGVDKFYLMPDVYELSLQLQKELYTLGVTIEIENMSFDGHVQDTIDFVERIQKKHPNCIVALGGDGTSRAVAKTIGDIPLIPVSTGTNNVYPYFIEGTVAGMAAAIVASHKFPIDKLCIRDKRIEIYKNDLFIDIALVDIVISKSRFTGAKAIKDTDEILELIACRCHPATIGFSALAGCNCIVRDLDDFGVILRMNKGNTLINASVAAGVIETINCDDPSLLDLGDVYEYLPEEEGTIALDGEKEIMFSRSDRIAFKITRKGPLRVKINETIELALNNGFFKVASGINKSTLKSMY